MSDHQRFIDLVADNILKEFGGRLHRLLIVFPNRRAAIFLRQALINRLGASSWLPEISSVEDAFASWSGFKLADTLDLIFELLDIHLSMGQQAEENLSTFAPYGIQMLNDFEEVDHAMVDSKKLFSFLSEAKAIEMWHPDGSPLSEYERKYLHFFRLLAEYHNRLSGYMNEMKIAYYGFIARYLTSLKPEVLSKLIPYEKVVFAGFTQLTKAEEQIFVALHQTDKASFFWNLDGYLLDESLNGYYEAGASLRRMFHRHPQLKPERFSNKLMSKAKEVRMIGISSNTGQAYALGSNLQQKKTADHHTAVVLADEKLLIPVLHLIPENISHLNVTMGIPFHQGAVYSWILSFLELAIERQRFQTKNILPLQPMASIIHNELIRMLLPEKDLQQLFHFYGQLLQSGLLFIDEKRITDGKTEQSAVSLKFFKQIVELLRLPPLEYIQEVYQMLLQWFSQSEANLQTASLQFFMQQLTLAKKFIHRLTHLFQTRTQQADFTSLKLLFINLSHTASVQLRGEPLEGLQLMGLLETRNLDFDEIHIVSANEGTLPASKATNSLIPNDIRRQFGLAVAQDKQNLFAIHFYHLIAHASRVFLYYNTEPDPLGGGEMSRFLLQLKYELSQHNTHLSISEDDFILPIQAPKNTAEILIEKTPETILLIRKKLEKGISASSLSHYFTCPLKFFLMDVLDIEEPEYPEKDIAANMLGTMVHNSLETLYQPLLNTNLTNTMLKQVREQLPDVVQQVFKEKYSDADLERGYIRLAWLVAQKLIEGVIELDEQTLITHSIRILHLEATLQQTLTIANQPVKLKGIIDRVDLLDGKLRIIDYKTGKVESKELTINEADDYAHKDKGKALQLALYEHLFRNTNQIPPTTEINAGIVSLRRPLDGLQPVNQKLHYPLPVEDIMHLVLEKIAKELLDTTTPIKPSDDPKSCIYCPFKEFCMRGS